MSIGPEHVEAVTNGITPYQVVILIFLGILILLGLVNLMKWMIDLKLGTIPKDIQQLKDDIKNLNSNLTQNLQNLEKSVIEIRSKLWTKEDIANEITSAINKHILECPLRSNPEKK